MANSDKTKVIFKIMNDLSKGEVSEKTLQHFLLAEENVAKRLYEGKTGWPNEEQWRRNAEHKVEELEKEYEEARQTFLNGRAETSLSKLEQGQLEEIEYKFCKEISREYRIAGIEKLEDCCYQPAPGFPFGGNFTERLTYLLKSVLKLGGRPAAKETILRWMREYQASNEDINQIECMDEGNYSAMADFLVARAKQGQKEKMSKRNRAPKARKATADQGEEILLPQEKPSFVDPLPPENEAFVKKEDGNFSLTNTVFFGRDRRTVIHREQELADLKTLLTEQPGASVMLSGFGGIGKTTLARVLWKELQGRFNNTVWVNYQKDLQTSPLVSIKLQNKQTEQDLENRKTAVCDWLKAEKKSSTFLVIDNLDSNPAIGQDPLTDTKLKEVSGLPNVTVLITSRLEPGHLSGYDNCYSVTELGDEAHRKEFCADLFCSYYLDRDGKKALVTPEQRGIVDKLVLRAGYHTYAIELLAKSARRAISLEEYYKKIEEAGFQFPQIKIYTDHSGEHAKAAQQLRKLFDMSTRSEQERRILWDFSVLPDTVHLNAQELKDWLGYNEEDDDLNRLIYEGWLLFDQGYYMHPLVWETMHLYFENNKAPEGTAITLFDVIANRRYNLENDSAKYRFLSIVNGVLKYVSLQDTCQTATIYWNMGDLIGNLKCKDDQISFYEKVLCIFSILKQQEPGSFLTQIADVNCSLAKAEWEKSERTVPGMKKAEEHLHKAIDIYSAQLSQTPNEDVLKAKLMFAYQDLGEVLSYPYDGDKEEDPLGNVFPRPSEVGNWDEARKLLYKALEINRDLLSKDFDRYAVWMMDSCYKLEQFLCYEEGADKEREHLLRIYLEIYQALEAKEKQVDEWVCQYVIVAHYDLICLLQKNGARLAEIEQQCRQAIDMFNRSGRDNFTFWNWWFPATSVYWKLVDILIADRCRHTEAEGMCQSKPKFIYELLNEFKDSDFSANYEVNRDWRLGKLLQAEQGSQAEIECLYGGVVNGFYWQEILRPCASYCSHPNMKIEYMDNLWKSNLRLADLVSQDTSRWEHAMELYFKAMFVLSVRLQCKGLSDFDVFHDAPEFKGWTKRDIFDDKFSDYWNYISTGDFVNLYIKDFDIYISNPSITAEESLADSIPKVWSRLGDLMVIRNAEIAEAMYALACSLFAFAEDRVPGRFSFRLLDNVCKYIRRLSTDNDRHAKAISVCYEALDFFEIRERGCPGFYKPQITCLESLLDELKSKPIPVESKAQQFFTGQRALPAASEWKMLPLFIA